jgi:hypothetical protein
MQPTPNTTFPLHASLAWWYGKWRSSSDPPTWRDLEASLSPSLLPHIIVGEAKTEQAPVRYRYVGKMLSARVGTDPTGSRVDEFLTGDQLALVMSLNGAVRKSGRPVLSLSDARDDQGDGVAAAVPRLWRLFLPLRLVNENRRPVVVVALAFDDAGRSADERLRLQAVLPCRAVDEVSREALPAVGPERLRAEVARCRHVARFVEPSALASSLEETARQCDAQAARLERLLNR